MVVKQAARVCYKSVVSSLPVVKLIIVSASIKDDLRFPGLISRNCFIAAFKSCRPSATYLQWFTVFGRLWECTLNDICAIRRLCFIIAYLYAAIWNLDHFLMHLFTLKSNWRCQVRLLAIVCSCSICSIKTHIKGKRLYVGFGTKIKPCLTQQQFLFFFFCLAVMKISSKMTNFF